MRTIVLLSAFIGVHLCGVIPAFSQTPVPSPAGNLVAAAERVEQSKAEVQRLKDSFDKARLESTLYDQRAKRAYQRWVKAAKSAREQAKSVKERAEWEMQRAVEKRKVAFDELQAAQFRSAARELEVKALEQDANAAAGRLKVKSLDAKLSPPTTPK